MNKYGNIRAEYGKELLIKLSKKLTNKYSTKFSRSGLQNMRLFIQKLPDIVWQIELVTLLLFNLH